MHQTLRRFALTVKKPAKIATSSKERILSLRDTLFTNKNEALKQEYDEEELENREKVALLYKTYALLKDDIEFIKHSMWVDSKKRAMELLEEVSPELAKEAGAVDYSFRPRNTPLPTVLPPIELPYK